MLNGNAQSCCHRRRKKLAFALHHRRAVAVVGRGRGRILMIDV